MAASAAAKSEPTAVTSVAPTTSTTSPPGPAVTKPALLASVATDDLEEPSGGDHGVKDRLGCGATAEDSGRWGSMRWLVGPCDANVLLELPLPGPWISLQSSSPFHGLLVSPPDPSSASVPDPSHDERRPADAARRARHDPAPTPDESLDPVVRQAAQMAPPVVNPITPPPAEAPTETRARSSLEELLPALVRKVAWSGDGRRGTVRLELGSGALSGAELLVESNEGQVRVRLRAPAGVDLGAWRTRVGRRLAARGLDVETIEAD